MGEGEVSYKQAGREKTLDPRERQKWLEKLSQIQKQKNLRSTILGDVTSY